MIEQFNFSKYEPKTYEEKVNLSGGWIDYGQDNLYPDYLNSLYKTSAVHGALCNSIAQMILGEGVEGLEAERLSLNKALRRAVLDLKIQGGFFLEVTFNASREGYKSIQHIPFERVRCGQMNVKGNIETFYYSLDWEDNAVSKIPVAAWNPALKKEHPVQIMYCRPFSVGDRYYPKPDYFAGLNWIELDKQISIHHVSNIKNGMMPSFAIHHNNGTPSPEERTQIRREYERGLMGAENSGRFIMTFGDAEGGQTTFESIEANDASDRYQFLSEECTNKIMISHRVTTPALMGVKTAGQLGQAGELEAGQRIFEENVLEPFRKVVNECLKGLYSIIEEDAAEIVTASDSSGDIEKSYSGIQVGSAVDVLGKYKLGELTKEQAREILIQMLGLSEDSVAKMFGETDIEENLQYSKQDKKKKAVVKKDKRYKRGSKVEYQSYTDYPDAVKNNAKRGIELNEKQGNKCATQTGKVRAQQLANGEAISLETIQRMYSYLSRAAEFYDETDTTACGTISYLLWGGKAALRWSKSKLAEIEELQHEVKCSHDMTDEHGEEWLQYLEGVGEIVDLEEWDLIDETKVTDPDSEALLSEAKLFKRFSNPDKKSAVDTGLYKVRYRYSRDLSNNSRDFCKKMVANSKNGVVYRLEDIEKMKGQNKEFAAKGESSYSIWKFKGGAWCQHYWVRQIYFRKRDNKGQFLPNKGLDNDKLVRTKPDIPYKDTGKGWDKASTAPRDMENNGRLNLSKIFNFIKRK